MHAYTDSGEGEQSGCTNQRSRLSPSISQVREALELGGPRNKEMGPHCLQPHPLAHAQSLALHFYRCEGPKHVSLTEDSNFPSCNSGQTCEFQGKHNMMGSFIHDGPTYVFYTFLVYITGQVVKASELKPTGTFTF